MNKTGEKECSKTVGNVDVNESNKQKSYSLECKWCIEIHPDQAASFKWATGKLETIKHHEKSKAHIKSVEIVAGKKKAAAGEETLATKSLQSLNKAVIDKLIILFRNAHALCLSGRPFTDFVWLTKLDKAKGLDIGNTYLNNKRAKEFTDYIAQIQLNQVHDVFEESNFVSVMSDGSTDSSITEIEIVLFVNAAHVSKSDATGIVGAIKRSIENVDVSWEDFTRKLVGMGSDGASVMLGNKNGVAAQLRKLQPSMVAVVNLEACQDNVYNIRQQYQEISSDHSSMSNYRSNLKDSFHSLGLKVMLPTRIGGTRWIGHLLRALTNFMSGYQAIKQHLEQVGSATEKVSNSTSGKAKVSSIKGCCIVLSFHGLFVCLIN
ncbi:zinc finger protein 862-like [Argopecten irradians]|uniref:zinc finger protein 862-like n=1 Tax=Argopecten irradians TaxID=31199 RepID=UPI00371B6F42